MNDDLKARFSRYLNAIQPTQAQRRLAKDELSFIEDKISEYIRDDDPFKFVKALRSGSFAKATALRRTDLADFDADIAVYVEEDQAGPAEISDLVSYLEKLTKRAYENRTIRSPKFERNESCVRAVFDVTPKINIDIVPVVALDHATVPNWGLLPKRDGTECHTSVTEHIEFVRCRNNPASTVPFRKLVRLFKRWRNDTFPYAEREKLSSFTLELILGKAYDEQIQALQGEALPDLALIAMWIGNHALVTEISFPDSRVAGPTIVHKSPVVVLDPINRDDNVTEDWTESDRDRFLDRVDQFRDVLRDVEIEACDNPDTAVGFIEQVFPNFGNLSED